MEHQYDISYYAKCPEENCHLAETGRRLSERVIDHNGLDKNSHIFKYSGERKHGPPNLQEFSILGRNYHKNKFRRKVAEPLLMK